MVYRLAFRKAGGTIEMMHGGSIPSVPTKFFIMDKLDELNRVYEIVKADVAGDEDAEFLIISIGKEDGHLGIAGENKKLPEVLAACMMNIPEIMKLVKDATVIIGNKMRKEK